MDSGFVRDKEFQGARIGAIESYANLEQQICFIFAAWLRTFDDRASVVFFRLSAPYRISILETLLEKEHGSEFDTFWHGQPGSSGVPKVPGLFTLIRQLDERRNKIVHWITAHHWGRDEHGLRKEWEDLTPPNWWSGIDGKPIGKVELIEFDAKACYVANAVVTFLRVTTGKFISHEYYSESERASWLQRFQKPTPYPPSDGDPLLFRNP